MVVVGDSAPEFTLSAALADGPVVLAFVPAAFTSACTEELCTVRDSLARFRELESALVSARS